MKSNTTARRKQTNSTHEQSLYQEKKGTQNVTNNLRVAVKC